MSASMPRTFKCLRCGSSCAACTTWSSCSIFRLGEVGHIQVWELSAPCGGLSTDSPRIVLWLHCRRDSLHLYRPPALRYWVTAPTSSSIGRCPAFLRQSATRSLRCVGVAQVFTVCGSISGVLPIDLPEPHSSHDDEPAGGMRPPVLFLHVISTNSCGL